MVLARTIAHTNIFQVHPLKLLNRHSSTFSLSVPFDILQPSASLLHRAEHRHLHHDQLHFDNLCRSLHWSSSVRSLSHGMRFHFCAIYYAFEENRLLGNLLVQMYSRCKSCEDALSVFIRIRRKNVFSFNAMISSYASHGKYGEALHLFEEMCINGLVPNKFIFSSIISACSTPQALQEGRNIHTIIKKRDLETDIVVGTSLLNMYGKCGSFDDAKELFYKLPDRDLISWNAMIAVSTQSEKQWMAISLYNQMIQEDTFPDEYTLGSILDACVTLTTLPIGKSIHASVKASGLEVDVVVGSALLNMYGKCECYGDALETFEMMPHQNRVTFINILSTCAAQIAIDEGRRMHSRIIMHGLIVDVNLGNALVNMYGKCCSLIDAHQMFHDMPERDVISWNAVIAVYSQNGQARNALCLFFQMKEQSVTPNTITFVNILSACSHAGLIKEGYQCFSSMERDHGVVPSVDHYNCIVDLLVRARKLDEAECFLVCMGIEPTVVSWTTLLGACRFEADLERGQRIVKHVLTLDKTNPAHHVTLANIYAAAGEGDEATKIMDKLREMDQVDMWIE